MEQMTTNNKKGINKILVALSIIIVAVLLCSFFEIRNLSKHNITYCKQGIITKNGYAFISEKDDNTSVILVDSNGKIKGQIKKNIANYLTNEMTIFEKIFVDEKDNVYVMASVISGKNPDSEKRKKCIYQCDFNKGELKFKRKITVEKKYSNLVKDVPVVKNNNIYMNFVNDENELICLSFNLQNKESSKIVKEIKIPENVNVAMTQYTSEGVVWVDTSSILYVDNQRISEEFKENVVYNGLHCGDDYISILDVENEAQHIYRFENSQWILEKKVEKNIEYSKLQSSASYDLSQVVACYEKGDKLVFYAHRGDGTNLILENIHGQINGSTVGNIVIKNIMIAIIMIFVCIAFFVVSKLIWNKYFRLDNKGNSGYERKEQNNNIFSFFIGINRKITIIIILVIGALVYFTASRVDDILWKKVAYYNKQERNETTINMSGYIYCKTHDMSYKGEKVLGISGTNDDKFEISNLDMKFTPEFFSELEKTVDKINSKRSNKIDLLMFDCYDDNVYCIYDGDDNEPGYAEYYVSYNAVEVCKKANEGSKIEEFIDNRSVGKLKYSFVKTVFVVDDTFSKAIVVATCTDGYVDKASKINAISYAWRITIGFAILIFIFIKGMLIIVTKKIVRFNKNLIKFEESNDYNVLKMEGYDEISNTSNSLVNFSETMNLQAKALANGNKYIARFIPLKYLKLMNVGKITNLNNSINKEVELTRIVMENKENLLVGNDEQIRENKEKYGLFIKRLISYSERYNGIFDNFDYERITIYFENRQDAEIWNNNISVVDKEMTGYFDISMNTGKMKVVVVGNETRSFLKIID